MNKVSLVLLQINTKHHRLPVGTCQELALLRCICGERRNRNDLDDSVPREERKFV
jgi:hypothetical protein